SNTIRLETLEIPPAEALRAERSVSVELDGQRQVRLDPANSLSAGFAQVLDGLSKQQLPVYLEIDPATSAITRLLIPLAAQVVTVRPMEDGSLGVELMPSHARHILPAASP